MSDMFNIVQDEQGKWFFSRLWPREGDEERLAGPFDTRAEACAFMYGWEFGGGRVPDVNFTVSIDGF